MPGFFTNASFLFLCFAPHRIQTTEINTNIFVLTVEKVVNFFLHSRTGKTILNALIAN